MADQRDGPDGAPSGVVELREDVPLKPGAGAGGGSCCAGGPRLIIASFTVLSVAITLALLAQIYSGDYEVVPHGVVSSSAAECSRAGTDALKRGGRALDAAAAAALCLAVVAPHRTSLDAGGSMLYWEYRKARWTLPSLAEWGGAEAAGERPPRLLVALATLHAQAGVLPWHDIVQPALQLARKGFMVSASLAAAERAAGLPDAAAGGRYNAPALADYLQSIQNFTSKELSESWHTWNANMSLKAGGARWAAAGRRRVWAGGARAAVVLGALAAALQPPPAAVDDAVHRAVSALRSSWGAGQAGGVASGLAVVDSFDTYIALVTGTSVAFGSGALTAAGWRLDHPTQPLDLAPAIIADQRLCGTRYVIGGESSAAVVQAAAALAATEGVARGVQQGVERARLALAADGALLLEPGHPPPAPPPALLFNATPPFPSVNVVQQRGDALLSWADSRGGGVSSRF
ncbi:glutathione hydrolase 6-like isoform X2 [Plodia interpunctella]|uniref:glutathione hydrolase 6-like isoform X2 n=1 Tax=Plodia interpunctella TaxID=58824 RepID=UPI00236759AD|nr:glutathione hydrolase 6-like isoform X2 [Plodia interpunctella]